MMPLVVETLERKPPKEIREACWRIDAGM